MKIGENDRFRSILETHLPEDQTEFLELLDTFQLRKGVERLPDALWKAMESDTELGLGTPDFGKVMKQLIDKLNGHVRHIPESPRKARIKYLFSVFGQGLYEMLLQDFPQISQQIQAELSQSAKEIAAREDIDAEDLYQHIPTPKPITDPPALPPHKKTRAKSSKSDYFEVDLSPKQLELLEEQVRRQYSWTNYAGRFANFLHKDRKKQKPLMLQAEFLPHIVHLCYRLWKERLIHPQNGRFWNTLEAKLTDTNGKAFSKDLRKLASRIRKDDIPKYLKIRKEAEEIIQELKK